MNTEPEHPRGMHHELLDLFDELTFKQKVSRVMRGLHSPKTSGDYKYARLQILRLMSPAAAIIVPVIFALLLAVFAKIQPEVNRQYVVEIVDPEPVEEIEEIEELLDEPIEPPEPIEMDFTPDVSVPSDVIAPAPPTELSPQPAEFDSVSIVRSPVVMRGIYGSRSPGSRGAAMREFGGSGYTEGAVIRALRWLKHEQKPDGSWPKRAHAMTALALLTFLAHGETPASEEFGETVEKAIHWLLDHADKSGGFPRSYQHPIATYALCEAYALTKVPMIKDVAEKAVDIIIQGQNPQGGWCYALKSSDPSDTSVMGWCAQALKAAKMAGIENPQLKHAIEQSIRGFQANAAPQGGFGYRGPGATGLTGVGTLCMQLLGAEREGECKRGLMKLEGTTYNWEGGGKFNANYYWYYITQAKFHAGGKTWTEWNRMFAPVLVKNQTVIKDVYVDQNGEKHDMGWWDMPKEIAGHSDGPVMNTTLCALQLQVYYRYLPTFKKPEVNDELGDEDVAADDDIDIEISI